MTSWVPNAKSMAVVRLWQDVQFLWRAHSPTGQRAPFTHVKRTAQGSQTLAALAAVIDTCRQHRLTPWDFLAQKLRRHRKG